MRPSHSARQSEESPAVRCSGNPGRDTSKMSRIRKLERPTAGRNCLKYDDRQKIPGKDGLDWQKRRPDDRQKIWPK
eukprot:4189085-Pleurochrysis_carterae.AAC.1